MKYISCYCYHFTFKNTYLRFRVFRPRYTSTFSKFIMMQTRKRCNFFFSNPAMIHCGVSWEKLFHLFINAAKKPMTHKTGTGDGRSFLKCYSQLNDYIFFPAFSLFYLASQNTSGVPKVCAFHCCLTFLPCSPPVFDQMFMIRLSSHDVGLSSPKHAYRGLVVAPASMVTCSDTLSLANGPAGIPYCNTVLTLSVIHAHTSGTPATRSLIPLTFYKGWQETKQL